MEFLPEIVPVFMTLLKDSTPAVARQAITCAIELFRSTLEKIAVQVTLFPSIFFCHCNFFGPRLLRAVLVLLHKVGSK